MTSREQLYENYEDALFAILMDKVANEEGRLLLEENERLNQDPNAKVPETLDYKCRRIIKKSFSKNRRYVAFTIIRRIGNRVAIVLLACVVLFTVAYATVAEVRTITLNLLLELTDSATRFSFSDDKKLDTDYSLYNDVYGYDLTVVPSEFQMFLDISDDKMTSIRYRNDEGAEIHFSIGGNAATYYNVDTENVDSVENVIIHGYEGVLITDDNFIRVAWGDVDQELFINITTMDVDKDVVMAIADNMKK